MRRRVLICVVIALLSTGSADAQGCRQWTEVLVQSFLPKQVDEDTIREIAGLSAEQYFTAMGQKERENLAQMPDLQAVSLPDVDQRLRTALERFYEAGFKLYGVRFDAKNLGISPAANINAFASGSHVFLNRGLLLYYQHPLEYLTQTGHLSSQLSPQDYYRIKSVFSWENDWNGIYFVLAHEAAHNLMRHRDQQVFEHVGGMVGDYRQALLDHRKGLAEGRGSGFGRYMWRSTLRFLESFQQGSNQRDLESEADIVGMTLLRETGFDPAISISAAEKMGLMLGGAQITGFNAAMTDALCSTHPDWMVRISTMQQNLGCIRFMGRPCNQRITYPVEDTLQKLRTGITQLQQYEAETVRIAGLTGVSAGTTYEVELDVNPKDADIVVDGTPNSRGKIGLAIGKHELAASKPGYLAQRTTFVVFPDVRSRVKLKLKKP